MAEDSIKKEIERRGLGSSENSAIVRELKRRGILPGAREEQGQIAQQRVQAAPSAISAFGQETAANLLGLLPQSPETFRDASWRPVPSGLKSPLPPVISKLRQPTARLR